MTLMLKKGKSHLETAIVQEFISLSGELRSQIHYQYPLDISNRLRQLPVEQAIPKILSDYTEVVCNRVSQAIVKIIRENLYTQEEMEKDLGLNK